MVDELCTTTCFFVKYRLDEFKMAQWNSLELKKMVINMGLITQ